MPVGAGPWPDQPNRIHPTHRNADAASSAAAYRCKMTNRDSRVERLLDGECGDDGDGVADHASNDKALCCCVSVGEFRVDLTT